MIKSTKDKNTRDTILTSPYWKERIQNNDRAIFADCP